MVLLKFSSKTFVVPDLAIINNGTVSRITARMLSAPTAPVLEVDVNPGIESNAAALAFRWNVTEQTD